jgi:hypothetical protein
MGFFDDCASKKVGCEVAWCKRLTGMSGSFVVRRTYRAHANRVRPASISGHGYATGGGMEKEGLVLRLYGV